MNLSMDPRTRRPLALALLAMALVAAYLILVAPWFAYGQSLDRAIEQSRFQLARYERMAGKRALFEQAVARYQGTAENNRFYLRQSTSALALAELEQHLEQLLRGTGAQIVSTQGVQESKGQGDNSIVLRVRMRADLVTLANLFYQLETGSPTLFLDQVGLSAPAGVGRAQTASPANTALDAQFDLTGFLQGETS